jgi:4'-phosphopantetheinyl transferase
VSAGSALPATELSPIAPPRGVDLWTVSLEQPAPREARLIAGCSPRELARAARMPVERRRRDFLVGRGIVRSILGSYLGIPPGDVDIAVGAHGKPFVDSPAAPAFNVSHSCGLAVIAVSAGFRVGIDLERVDPDLDVMAIAQRFLPPQDEADLASLAADARATAFFRLWTRREACVKANGTGFTGGLCAALARSATPVWDGARTIVDLQPAPGYVGALVYEAPPALVRAPDHASACS